MVGVFIEPVGIIAVFLIIFSLIRGYREDIDIALFLASGIILFTLFNDIAIRSINAMKANEALFYYKTIKPIDTVIARTIVEMGLYAIVYIIIISFIFILKEKITLDDFPILVITYLLLSLTAFAIGLILMISGHRYPWIAQIVPLLMRPLWFISGVFFSLQQVPQTIVPFISWNPILQAVEISRNALSINYVLINQISLNYLFILSISLTTIALWIYKNNEKILLTR